MKPTVLSIDILRLLIDKNIYLSLKEITNFLPKHRVTQRTIQKELKKLSDFHIKRVNELEKLGWITE